MPVGSLGGTWARLMRQQFHLLLYAVNDVSMMYCCSAVLDVLQWELVVEHLQKCGECLTGLEMAVKYGRGVVRTGNGKERTGIGIMRL